ncbi:MAG TPA: ImmA/IrrE family metallo-endopeptidase [Solirubrobacterales bacterium]|nr:ImmA/IrrE family metallo-endopeptidase [Solirubrobacterales bacterium]
MFVAAEAHEDMAVDTAREIDVFAAIESLGLDLLFRPLVGAAGLYIGPHAERPGGVLINSRHRRARQRYTGGHELGHHLMGHSPSLEPEDRSTGALSEQLPPEEMLAEAFAAWFLMPPELVDKVMDDLALRRPRGPADVYALALRLGTSFEATALHLANLKLVQPGEAREWASMSLKWVKEALCAGHPPTSYRGDIWALTVGRDKLRLALAAGDRLVLTLPDSPARYGNAILSVVTDAGVEEMLDGTRIIEDAIGGEPGNRRVLVDFEQDDNGCFRLMIPSEDSLPGLGKEVMLELTVRPSDFGRRSDAICETTNESEGSISPIMRLER